MTEEREEQTASSKLGSFIEKNRKVLIAIFAIVLCALICFIVYSTVANKAVEKNLQAIDERI